MPGIHQNIISTISHFFLGWLCMGLSYYFVSIAMGGEINLSDDPMLIWALLLPILCLGLIRIDRVLGILLATAGLPIWLGLRFLQYTAKPKRLARITHGQSNRG